MRRPLSNRAGAAGSRSSGVSVAIHANHVRCGCKEGVVLFISCLAAASLYVEGGGAAEWPGLGEAVDAPQLEWQSTGWFANDWLTHDGTDAANCESVWGLGATLQTTVEGPALIEFWWVFHLGPFNPLQFSFQVGSSRRVTYDGILPAEWQAVSVDLPAGPQPLTWAITGGYILAEFPFAAIDEVVVRPPAVPTLLEHPRDLTVGAGQQAAFLASASGGLVRYQWYKQDVPLPEATNFFLVFPAASLQDTGSYAVVVSNFFGSVTSSLARLSVLPRLTEPRLDGGLFVASLLGLPAEGTVIISSSTDLTNWNPVVTNSLPPASLPFQWPAATNRPCQFYRAVVR
jgi:hypothetical protein